MANMVVVNGPIRNEIGMNSGIGALGPYNHANATIGRAYGLLSQNLQGGSVPGLTYMGSQGNNFAYNSLTFAENEEASPWKPFHVQHGSRPTRAPSPSSTAGATSGPRALRTHWDDKLKTMLSGHDPYTDAILVLDPIVAREFVDRGFDLEGEA